MNKIETICRAFRSFLTMRDNSGRMARHKFHWLRIRSKYKENREKKDASVTVRARGNEYKSLSFPKISRSVTVTFSTYFFTNFIFFSMRSMEKTFILQSACND